MIFVLSFWILHISTTRVFATEDTAVSATKPVSEVRCVIVAEGARPKEIQQIADEAKRYVIGQDEAIDLIVDTLSIARAGMNDPKKPFTSVLVLGPTGVGKTETVKAMVKAMGGDFQKNVIRLDGANFGGGHEGSALTGTAPGYAGYGEATRLDPQSVEKTKFSAPFLKGSNRKVGWLLFDELEKASRKIDNTFLPLLDEGYIEDLKGQKTDFREHIVFMTSNAGATKVAEAVHERQKQLDSEFGVGIRDATGRNDAQFAAEVREIYMKALSEAGLTPEFRNRFDAIVVYYHLGREQNLKILEKELAMIQQTILLKAGAKVLLKVTDTAKIELVRQGMDLFNGARNLQRSLKKLVRKPISEFINMDRIQDGDRLVLDFENGSGFQWSKESTGMNAAMLAADAAHEYPGFGLDRVSTLDVSNDLEGSRPQEWTYHEATLKNLWSRITMQPLKLEGTETMIKFFRVDSLIYKMKRTEHSSAVREFSIMGTYENFSEINLGPKPSITEKDLTTFKTGPLEGGVFKFEKVEL